MRLSAALVLGLALLAAAGAEEGGELLPNGGFEEGAAGATRIPGWTEVDGLTTFFTTIAGRGRVLLIDTDVNLVEADERWKEMELPTEKRQAARPKGVTREPKYDTVGGTTGAKIFSDYLRVEPLMRYRLRADVKSDGPIVMIFVKGYAEFEGGYRKFYQWYKNVNRPTGEWETFEGTFNPTVKSPKVTHIRVMPYAYWPPGPAWIDNLSVTRVGREEPGAAEVPGGLLPNGDFSRPGLDPWTAEGVAERADLGGEASCGRILPGGALLSPRIPAPAGREL
ncbi:MAG: hypothetical protein MUE73_16875, partial [Planctomycetes bacterium]|nr:hypothetical protein [Planctomycetota bacterium]